MSSVFEETKREAMKYAQLVKERFKDRQNMYNEFIHVLKEFTASRIDTHGVIVKMEELFEGDQDLLLGFKNFIPSVLGIRNPPTPENENDDDGGGDDDAIEDEKPTFENAICFVNKIKARFDGDANHLYKSFLEILASYKKDISRGIRIILDGKKILIDLIEEFTHFLPTSSKLSMQNSAAVYMHENPNSDQWIIEGKTECDYDKGANGLMSNFFGKVKQIPKVSGAFKKILDFLRGEDS